MSLSNEYWMVEVMNMYLTFQIHEDDELILIQIQRKLGIMFS